MLLFQVVRVFQTLPRSKQWRSDASQSIDYAILLKSFFPDRPSPSLSSAPDLSPGEPSTLSFYPIPTLASFWLAEGWLFKDSKLYPVSTRRLIPLSQHPRYP